MNKIYFFLIISYLCSPIFSQNNLSKKKPNNNPYFILKNIEDQKLIQINKKLDSLTTHTLPKDAIFIRHKAFYSAYSAEHKQPYWVAHIVPKDILYGSYTKNNGFAIDSLYLKTADSTDYLQSGYDRGHMAPAADFKWHKEAIKESFFYTNVAPQVPEFNRGAWAKVETLVRELAIEASEVYVITGPVLHKKLPNLQQGSYQVSIPKLFYKIIYDIYPPEYKAMAFLLPNQKNIEDIQQYIVSVDSIETLTGIDFMNILTDSIENKIEQNSNLKDWGNNYFDPEKTTLNKHYGSNKLNTLEAQKNIGKECTVCGKAVSIKLVDNGKTNPTYINLDKKFPEHLFTIVIYDAVRKKLGYIPEEKLLQKEICITGKIEQYKGIPQIVLQKESVLKILE